MTVPKSTAFELSELILRKAPEYLDLLSPDDAVFEKAFDAQLGRAVQGLETNSKNFAPLKEDGLTAALALALAVPCIEVSQQLHSNGHVDITIKIQDCHLTRTKLGEAKIYDGPEWHFQGVKQLLGYSTGRECRGLVIAYVKKANIEGLMKKVRERMDQDLPEQQQGVTTDLPSKWCFLSKHLHPSGAVVEIGHVGCNMHVVGE
ncbi:hypothetical protein [Paraburkholderia sp. BL21I4N1]|uniref:hypothetical protein n=1 Tax=Paraburkholderia sp. BL21I4N1 TaxID=1938801 RepID=UPI000CFB708D|nr:hypothetical protein [Paraburkholderia sp. BL21I4N1]PQV45144.1 hypothetical protein B0G83_11857 [Paraburkholderia sp. BL21I4N1]